MHALEYTRGVAEQAGGDHGAAADVPYPIAAWYFRSGVVALLGTLS
jgi:hypothetical protein